MTSTTLNFDLFARDHASSTFNRFGSAVSGSTKSVSTLRSGLGSLVKGFIALGVVYKATQFFKESVSEASDLSETINKSTIIFGKNADEVMDWSQTSATAFGLSQNSALAAASQLGNMFTQLGFTGGAATEMSTSTVKLAADLGSFNNLGTEDVLARIEAGFRGEYDSLQALIPNINAARVESEALKETGKELASELTAQEKASAALAIITKDGAAAQDDFAETSGGLANQQKILAAQWDNLQAKIGTALLPMLQRLATFATDTMIPWISETYDTLSQKLGPAFGDLADAAGKLREKLVGAFGFLSEHKDSVKAVGAAVVALTTAMVAATVATRTLAAAQLLLNSVLLANPIGATVFGVVALSAALVVAYNESKTFAKIVDAAFLGVIQSYAKLNIKAQQWSGDFIRIGRTTMRLLGGVFDIGWGLITGDWRQALNGLSTVTGTVFGAIQTKVRGYMKGIEFIVGALKNRVSLAFKAAWNLALTATVSGVMRVAAQVASLPGKMAAALGGLAGMFANIGVQAVQGLITGMLSLKEVAEATIAQMGLDLASKLSRVLNIGSPSKVFFAIGQNIVDGLTGGIKQRKATLQKVIEDVAATVSREGDKLRTLMQEKLSFTDSFQSGFTTSVFGSEKQSLAGMLQFQKGQKEDAVRLRNDSRRLLKMGLNQSVIDQLAAAGAGGLQQIHALAGGTAGQVRRFNTLNAQTQAALGQAGNLFGNDVYGDKIAAQRERVENAKAIEDAVRKGFDGAKLKIVNRHGDSFLMVRGGANHG